MVLVHIGTIVGLSRERQFFRAPLALWQNLLALWCHPPGLSRIASSRPNKQQLGKRWQKHAIYNQYVYIYTFQYVPIHFNFQVTSNHYDSICQEHCCCSCQSHWELEQPPRNKMTQNPQCKRVRHHILVNSLMKDCMKLSAFELT